MSDDDRTGHPRRPERLPDEATDWAARFAAYRDVVLVANSDAVDIDDVAGALGSRTLFVFFNKTYKVLAGPFGRPALLVARSSAAGANIVYRREVAEVVEPFRNGSFLGILNLRAGADERFSPAEDFAGVAVGYLDLADDMADVYPTGRVATSGFALAVWLATLPDGPTLHLAGFSARRSDRWKLFKDHDWTYEQTALRLLHRAGRFRIPGKAPAIAPLAQLLDRFPEIDRADVVPTAVEVLAERLDNTDGAVDRLFSLTKLHAAIDRLARALKPRTRKERMREGG